MANARAILLALCVKWVYTLRVRWSEDFFRDRAAARGAGGRR
jgi:hypothetical protein